MYIYIYIDVKEGMFRDLLYYRIKKFFNMGIYLLGFSQSEIIE